MTLRSQTIAILVLFVLFGVVFVLVGDTGVSTDAIKATRTPVPTATATPLAVADTTRWVEVQPGQLQYATDDPTLQGQIAYVVAPQAELLELLGIQPPAEDAQYLLLDLIGQRHTALVDSVNERQFLIDPAVDHEPVLRVSAGIPLAQFQVRVEIPGTDPGAENTVIDVIELMAQGSEDGMVFVQYSGSGSQAITTDFWGWLEENIVEIAGVAEAEAEPDATEAAPEPVESTPEAADTEPDATEAAPEPTESTDSTPEVTEAAPEPAESTPEASQ